MMKRYGTSYGESYADHHGAQYEGSDAGGYGAYEGSYAGGYGAYEGSYAGGYGAYEGSYAGSYGAYEGSDTGGYGTYEGSYAGGYGAYEGSDAGGYGAYEEGYPGGYGAYEENDADDHGVYYEDSYGRNKQEEPSFSKAGILKCAMAFLVLVYIVLLLIYTSGSTKPFDDVAASVEAQLDKESLVRQDAQALKRYYGLNSADYEGAMYYSAEFSISALEVLLIEVKTDQQVQEVRDAVEERLESRKDTFEGYAPEQAQLIEQAQLLVRGRFVFLAVSPDAENYVTAFTKSL